MTDLRDQLQSTLGPAYAIERELAGGGMARVFLARDTALNRSIVVKILHPTFAADVSAKRFEREVQLAARLQQANIVPVLSTGDMNGLPYYTMPYIDGSSLRDRLKEGVLPVGDALSILRDVARALVYAHEHGVVHRDIKPGNILLSGDTAVVADFGIAKALSASRTHADAPPIDSPTTLTHAGVSLGTPAYMAPEQALADPATDHRADIYAWGCVAYETLTGTTPFGNRLPQQLLKAHVSESPAPLRTHRPEIPAYVEALVLRSLEKEPVARPNSARELLQALESASTTGVRRVAKKRPTVIGVGVVIVALLAVVGVYALGRRSVAADAVIAIIPRVAVGEDATQTAFSMVVGANVLTTLAQAQIPRLSVLERYSTQLFSIDTVNVRRAAKELRASHVLELHSRRAGAKVFITADLVRADGSMVWTSSYNEPELNLQTVEREIARAVAGALSLNLAGATLNGLRHEPNSEAYALYSLGRTLLNRGSRQDLRRAIQYFDSAAHRDTSYAAPFAAAAWAWHLLAATAAVAPVDAYLVADSLANRARALDETSGEAHALLGLSRMIMRWDWAGGRTEIEHALRFNPNDATAHFANSIWFQSQGDLRRALAEMQKAEGLERLSGWFATIVANQWDVIGQLDSAKAALKRVEEADPGYGMNFGTQSALLRFDEGRFEDALAIEKAGGQPTPLLIRILIKLGRRAAADSVLDLMVAETTKHWVVPEQIAMAELALGHRDLALDWLERGARAHSSYAMVIRVDPAMRSLLTDPRYVQVLKEMHLDDVAIPH